MSFKYTPLLLSLLFTITVISQENSWKITSKTEIERSFGDSPQAYADNIEMSGKRVAAIVSYAVDSTGILSINREIFFPQLHPFIKESDPDWFVYRAYLKDTHTDNILPKLFVGNKQFTPGPLDNMHINGMLQFKHRPSKLGLQLERSLFPSMSERLFIEEFKLTNTTDSTLTVLAQNAKNSYGDQGASGSFKTIVSTDVPLEIILSPGESVTYSVRIAATLNDENAPSKNLVETRKERKAFLNDMNGSLQLETPNPVLNTLFEFSKIRASESIFESRFGLIHSPGGGRYYVGIWANDQAEYVSPFFPYLGYKTGHTSAMNMYRAFAKEMNPEYTKLPYSFEVEGLAPKGDLDRGDAAMIAYGASQYALATGNQEIAEELWPLITWCLEYNKRQLNKEGVVKSASDEMEGRIETGSANLSTSSLYYGALRHAADLGKSLGKSNSVLNRYKKQGIKLKKAINSYFGTTIEGLNTYRYYKGHEYLRHWICLPLVVGINDKKEATIEALFDRLWSDNGVHVEKNSDNEAITKIFWDRGTLYALRGTFLAGATEISLNKLEQFSKERLLGNRVPYVVEAYPEGNMAHLSAESGLYCRVFTEGLFGMNPTGLDSFTVTPRLPKEWDRMALRKIKAFEQNFDIEVAREGTTVQLKIKDAETGTVLLNKTSTEGVPVSFSFTKG